MKKNALFIANLFLAILACALLSHYYVSTEQDIYFWDYMRSWRMYFQLGELAQTDFKSFIDDVGYSIYSFDYNALSSLLLLPFYYLLPNGDNRFSFIFAITVIYLIPTTLLICSLIKQISNNFTPKKFYFCFWIILSFTAYWKPIMRGYTDISGMIPILFVLNYILKHDLSLKFKTKHAIIIGVSLWLAFVLRRWYAYSIVAMYLVLPFTSLWISNSPLSNRKQIEHTILNYFFAGLTTFFCVFLFQQYLLQDILGNNYREAYSAYRFSNELNFSQFIDYFGYIFIVIGFVSWAGAIYFIPKSRKILTSLIAICIISYYLFYQTVSPDMHHFIPIATYLIISTLIFILWLTDKKMPNFVKIVIFLSMPIASILIQLNTLLPYFPIHSRLLPSPAYPLYVRNYDNYVEMAHYLKDNLNENEKFVIVSADFKLNGSLFSRLIQQQQLAGLLKYTIINPDIDLRDGIPIKTLQAKYIVITNPAGTYLPSGQENIKIIHNILMKKQGIGRHYQEVARFKIDGDVDAIIYKKISTFSQEDAIHYINQFTQIYPQWNKVYMNQKTIDSLLK